MKSSVVAWWTVFWSCHCHSFNKCQKANTRPELCNAYISEGFISPGCWSTGSVAALFLMFCGEWWLLLLPDNSTTTFLMLTGLHIHLSALGPRLGHSFQSSAQGRHRHSHESFPPVVLCDCSQMRLTPFRLCSPLKAWLRVISCLCHKAACE